MVDTNWSILLKREPKRNNSLWGAGYTRQQSMYIVVIYNLKNKLNYSRNNSTYKHTIAYL